MILANPIYDVVFKRLMEDVEIAKGMISRLTGLRVVELSPLPQEVTQNVEPLAIEGLRLRVFRLDFAAEIEVNEGGEWVRKKVLIELQRAAELDATARFRNYLAKHYEVNSGSSWKLEEEVPAGRETKGAGDSGAEGWHPIIAIYFVAFPLADDLPCVTRVLRQYTDGITGSAVQARRHRFIESLTHDAVFVQVSKITDSVETELERALVLFKQRRKGNVTGELGWIVEVPEELLKLEDPLMKRMMRCLQKVVVDEEARKQMALEDELVGMLRRSEQALEREQIERQAKEAALAEAEHQRSVAERERAEKDRERTEKEKERTEKEKERAEKDAALAELEKLRAENARLRGSE